MFDDQKITVQSSVLLDRLYLMLKSVPLYPISSVPYGEPFQRFIVMLHREDVRFIGARLYGENYSLWVYRHNIEVTCVSSVSVDDFLLSIFCRKLISPLLFRHYSVVQQS
jgi:hypothetical protein